MLARSQLSDWIAIWFAARDTALRNTALNPNYLGGTTPAGKYSPLASIGGLTAALAAREWFDSSVMVLGWGVFAAGILQLCFQLPALAKLGLLPRPKLDFAHAGVRKILTLMVPTLFGSSVVQFNLLFNTMAASLLIGGSMTWLYYSDRLLEFPLGMFGVAIGTVILPHLSRQHAAENRTGYNHALDWGMKMVCLVGIPAAVGLVVLAEPLCATLFQYHKFTAADTRMVAAAVSAMSVGIPAFMLSKVLLPAFYARQDTRTPMKVAVWTVLVNVVLIASFVTVLRLSGSAYGHIGIAFATAPLLRRMMHGVK